MNPSGSCPGSGRRTGDDPRLRIAWGAVGALAAFAWIGAVSRPDYPGPVAMPTRTATQEPWPVMAACSGAAQAGTGQEGKRGRAEGDPRPADGVRSPRVGPEDDPDDPTAWPNRASHANSDPWLVENHDKIRRMRPRLLLVNFSNEHPPEHLLDLADRIIAALKESTRPHGYRDPEATPFLNYEVFKFIDLRDADRTKGNSRNLPVKDPGARSGFNMKYSAYFGDEFAAHYGVADPKRPGRWLRLDELVDLGYVHEVWFFTSGTTAPGDPVDGAFEVVEEKPAYDARFRRVPGEFVQAGNGGDADQPWTGRSLRIGCVNASRGPGCFLESLAHGIEGTSNSGAIPYFTRYFREFAGLDLDERYRLPFGSLYGVQYGESPIRYPDPSTMIVEHAGKPYRVEGYVAAGGNAHFPPNARGHYDLDNPAPVLSTIETWRAGGPGGKGVVRRWTIAAFARYRELAPDCMGPWLVYWRQNMPGPGTEARDDLGRPMKNWWPFLFY